MAVDSWSHLPLRRLSKKSFPPPKNYRKIFDWKQQFSWRRRPLVRDGSLGVASKNVNISSESKGGREISLVQLSLVNLAGQGANFQFVTFYAQTRVTFQWLHQGKMILHQLHFGNRKIFSLAALLCCSTTLWLMLISWLEFYIKM